ncbi:hypothetical protein [Aquisphaera insulae]|uniref:hypothetical protein n=1 Tax=Aquisphaera insulae TaxID=2712864 RepID=UPI0013EAB21B|nr:hypothetical protein [Aquisphaera insulae]
MQIPILSLLLSCFGQVDEAPIAEPEPLHVFLQDRDPATNEFKQIRLTFPAGHVGRLRLADARIDEQAFDTWVYGNKPTATPELELKDKLRLRVGSAAVQYWLTEGQREKLRLAGKGDIKRFLEQADLRRAEFERKRRVFKEGREVLQGLSPLVKAYKDGPFGAGSMYAKTLEKMKRENALRLMLLRAF